jgi:hypothetical protein
MGVGITVTRVVVARSSFRDGIGVNGIIAVDVVLLKGALLSAGAVAVGARHRC